MIPKIQVQSLNLWYGDFQALKDVSMSMEEKRITAVIGPSGCGKSTLLRVFNRMNDLIEGVRTTGDIRLDGESIFDSRCDLVHLRKKVGMVFQRPNPLPISIYENIVFGQRIHQERRAIKKSELDQIVEQSLREVFLWDDLKDKLHERAISLQLEQQQKLCIARLLPLKPEVILMDEPCSALDAKATRAIEELMISLTGRYTMIIVTHNMAQARRISEECIFMLLGELMEHSPTRELFVTPRHPKTAEYIEGRYG